MFEIHQMLLEVIEEQAPEVYLIVDNHNTNKNSIVLAYLIILQVIFNFPYLYNLI